MNLSSAINSLPTTNIKFMYFDARDTKTPKITGTLRQLSNKNDYYISPGANGQNYFYIYRASSVKYMVRMRANGVEDVLHRVRVDVKGADEFAHHGDHITFGLIARRHPLGQVIVKTHRTMYSNNTMDMYNFERSIQECNFAFQPHNMSKFDHIKCENVHGYTGQTVAQVLTALEDREVVKMLCDAMMTGSFSVQLSQTAGGFRYTAKDFERSEFAAFLGEHVIQHLDQDGLEGVQVLFDATPRQPYKKNIVVLADYVDGYRQAYLLAANETFRQFRKSQQK